MGWAQLLNKLPSAYFAWGQIAVRFTHHCPVLKGMEHWVPKTRVSFLGIALHGHREAPILRRAPHFV